MVDDAVDMYNYASSYFPQTEADDFLDDAWNEASDFIDNDVASFVEDNAEGLV